MNSQKVFETIQKKLLQKPPYVKPKHRTYRQLLDLDRPKKIIQIQSDNQNDDFLQKLLKKQEKKQKQEKLKQKQKSKSCSSKRINKKQQQVEKNCANKLKQNEKNVNQKQNQNHNQINSAVILQIKKNEQIRNNDFQKNYEIISKISQENPEKQQLQNSKQQFTQIQSPSKISPLRRRYTSSILKSDNRPIMNKKKFKNIVIDDKIGSIAKQFNQENNLIYQEMLKCQFRNTLKPKSGIALKQLQKNAQNDKNQGLSNNFHSSSMRKFDKAKVILNSQSKEIIYKISPCKLIQKDPLFYQKKRQNVLFLNATRPLQELFTKTFQKTTTNYIPKLKQSLFRNSFQQQIFRKSLHNS